MLGAILDTDVTSRRRGALKDDSAYRVEKLSREGDENQEGPGTAHVRNDGAWTPGDSGNGREWMDVRE